MEHLIKISADSLQKLRRIDVFRVIEWAPDAKRAELARYITAGRPDLAAEVAACVAEVEGTSAEPITITPAAVVALADAAGVRR